MDEIKSQATFNDLPEETAYRLLNAAREREREILYNNASAIAINSCVYAISKGSKPEKTKPDDFNPFAKSEEREQLQNQDAIALELLGYNLSLLPNWCFEILDGIGVSALEDLPERSLQRIYGNRYLALVDPTEIDGVVYCQMGLINPDIELLTYDSVDLFAWGSEHVSKESNFRVTIARVRNLAKDGTVVFNGALI